MFNYRDPLQDLLEKYKEYAPIILRLVAGYVFFVHGLAKFTGGVDKVAGFFATIGIPLAPVAAWFITLLELVGGIAIIFGLATRYLGLLFAADMTVAIFTAHLPKNTSIELPLTLLAMGLALAVLGSGKYGLDDVLCGKKKGRSEPETHKRRR